MNNVERFDPQIDDNDSDVCCNTCTPAMEPSDTGRYVEHDDYAALEAGIDHVFCNIKAPEKPTMTSCEGNTSTFNRKLHQWSAERITTLEHELRQSNKEVKRLGAKK